MKEIKCKIVKHFGDLSDPNETYVKELNLIEWGNNGAKYDLRTWKHNKETGEVTAGKGLTLSSNELKELFKILKNNSVGE